MSSHTAAVLTALGSPLSLQTLPTPTPGPDDLLIDVKAMALNPIDGYLRDFGFAIASYPAVPGSDVPGIVSSVGSGVPSSSAFKPDARVVAFAPSFHYKGKSEYGAYQTKVLVPISNATILPESISFNEGTLLPMAVVTAWTGWHNLDVPLGGKVNDGDKKGVVGWGASSSVGLAAVQVAARTLGYTVYAVASAKHEAYLKSLGAKAVFYYNAAAAAVSQVISTAKDDGVTVNLGYLANGELKPVEEIVAAFGAGALVASAIPLNEKSPKTEGVETRFVVASPEPQEQTQLFGFVFNTWLKAALDSGEFEPAPKPKVVPAGLEGLNSTMDELKAGVSGLKLVVEL